MISYRPFYQTLFKKGLTEYYLIFKQGLSANTIHRMKHGEAISTKTLNVLCEILALHKPALLVPYPKGSTSRGDQVDNAASFEKRGLARVLQQEHMNEESLVKALFELYHDRGEILDAMEKEASADGVSNVMAQIHEIVDRK